MRFRGKRAFGREKHAPGRRFQREVGGVRIDPNDAGNPERIAAATASLALDAAAFMAGTALRVDGSGLDRL
jgi:NAD(P)-dependent dehydrogenase (short-subunit alcohol dehydrogenase family)